MLRMGGMYADRRISERPDSEADPAILHAEAAVPAAGQTGTLSGPAGLAATSPVPSR